MKKLEEKSDELQQFKIYLLRTYSKIKSNIFEIVTIIKSNAKIWTILNSILEDLAFTITYG